jgi:hypothetical protein
VSTAQIRCRNCINANRAPIEARVTGGGAYPSPYSGGRGASMLSCYEFDVGISNTDLMWETDLRLTVSFFAESTHSIFAHTCIRTHIDWAVRV